MGAADCDDPETLAAAQAMRATGQHDVASIARVLGVSRASVYRVLRVAMEDAHCPPETS